jgi:hypothetical protein
MRQQQKASFQYLSPPHTALTGYQETSFYFLVNLDFNVFFHFEEEEGKSATDLNLELVFTWR